MGKLLRSKDILLLGLANLLDFTEEVRDPLHILSNSYKNMYGWVPKQYKKHNFYQLLSRSYKAKFIEKVEKNGKIYIRITSEGKNKIQRDFPMLTFQKKQWDRKWRIVMFDIEEINRKVRDRLRAKLRELGFGMLQESVFISPHDILQDFIEFSESIGIKDYLYVLETHKLIVGNEQEFANKVWKLDSLNEEYKNIVDLISTHGRTKKSDEQKEQKVRGEDADNVDSAGIADNIDIADVKNRWLRTIINDPFLPKEFLPKPWWGNEAEKLVKNLAT